MPSCEEASDHLATSRTSSRSLNIALLGYRSNPYSGGQGIYLKHLAKALTDAGHSVDVISGEPYPELDPGINLIKLRTEFICRSQTLPRTAVATSTECHRPL